MNYYVKKALRDPQFMLFFILAVILILIPILAPWIAPNDPIENDYGNLMIAHSDQFEAVQVWGLTDMMSWRSRQYPLLFDGRGNPKPAFWAVADPDSVE